MLNADRVPYFESCPRCGFGAYERLATHAYCVNCNYSDAIDDEFLAIPKWALDALEKVDPKRQLRAQLLELVPPHIASKDLPEVQKDPPITRAPDCEEAS